MLVAVEDRLKTTFRTKPGTFSFIRIPFGLINTGVTFHRAMDIEFHGMIGRSMVVYLDEVTGFSKKEKNTHFI